MAQPQKERRLSHDKWSCQAKQRCSVLVAGKILKSLHRDIAAEGDRNCKYDQENQLEALFSLQGRSNQTRGSRKHQCQSQEQSNGNREGDRVHAQAASQQGSHQEKENPVGKEKYDDRYCQRGEQEAK